MHNIMRNISIKNKLISMVMATCVAALILTGILYVSWNWVVYRRIMVEQLSVQTKIIADNCKAAVAFENAEDIKDILGSLRAESAIVFGGVYNKNGDLLTSYHRKGANKVSDMPDITGRQNYFRNGLLTVVEPVILDEEMIGKVSLQANLGKLYAMLKNQVVITGIVIMLASLAAYILSSILQKLISEPILRLASTTNMISKNKDYSVRALKYSNDEIGQLIDSFNEMLEQIQQRDMQLTDVNEHLEDKIKERTDELLLANSALESTNEELKNFVYIASHDLREPLRKVTAFGAMLQTSLHGNISEDDEENLVFMIDGAKRMTQMIDGLLAYSRVSSKTLPAETVDVNEVIKQIRELELSVVIEEKKVALEIPQPLPCILADIVQIRQLLQNLIANGIKYQPLKNADPHITITSKPAAAGMVRIEVTDNGIGIKPEYLQSVFAMFKRLHSKNEYEGTGIGLAVCKKIVERQGGQIGVESEFGKGSTFWFTAPLAGEKSSLQEAVAQKTESE